MLGSFFNFLILLFSKIYRITPKKVISPPYNSLFPFHFYISLFLFYIHDIAIDNMLFIHEFT